MAATRARPGIRVRTRSVKYGCIRTRSHSALVRSPAFDQIWFDTPSRPTSWRCPARRTASVSWAGKPEPVGGGCGEGGDDARVSERKGTLQIGEVPDRRQQRVDGGFVEPDLGVGRDRQCQCPRIVRRCREEFVGVPGERIDDGRIEVSTASAAAPWPPRLRHRTCGGAPRRCRRAGPPSSRSGSPSPPRRWAVPLRRSARR